MNMDKWSNWKLTHFPIPEQTLKLKLYHPTTETEYQIDNLNRWNWNDRFQIVNRFPKNWNHRINWLKHTVKAENLTNRNVLFTHINNTSSHVASSTGDFLLYSTQNYNEANLQEGENLDKPNCSTKR